MDHEPWEIRGAHHDQSLDLSNSFPIHRTAADRMPPFLLKEKVAPKVQADFDAATVLKRTFLFPKSAGTK